MATLIAESLPLQPAPPASSLQVSRLAVVPGQPEWALRTVSIPVVVPLMSRDPHVSAFSVPLQRATNVYHTSRLLLESPQFASPSGVARCRFPVTEAPLISSIALAQASLEGRGVGVKR